MQESWTPSDELQTLTTAACCGELTEEGLERLEALLGDPRACRWYRDACLLQAELRILATADRADAAARASVRREAHALALPVVDTSSSPASPAFGYTPFGLLGTAAQSTAGFFSHGWPLAYLVAALVFGAGLLMSSLLPVSTPTQMAVHSLTPEESRVRGEEVFVGRVTGMVDCLWSDSEVGVINGEYLRVGRRIDLPSGLLEITYNSGARVILQGPVRYEVDSVVGGFLSVGKLTAKVESRESRVESHQTTAKSRAADRSQLSTLDSRLFSVRTPTAVVTDLGTEFGVEVTPEGSTTSHVFRGSVSVRAVTRNGAIATGETVLRENMSVRVEANDEAGGSPGKTTVLQSAAPAVAFVRVMPKPAVTTFDLVDVVAGGDGFSGRRSAGIDVNTGRPVSELISRSQDNPNVIVNGDGLYHRVEGVGFVDGVFVPDGSKGPQQTDSVGHRFAGFPSTTKTTSNHLWVGGIIPPGVNEGGSRTGLHLGGIDFSSDGHGFLFLHANKGITFDLDAIRKAQPERRLLRFRAVAGNVEWIFRNDVMMYADLWVLVDGHVRYQRKKINGWRGAFWVDVPLHDQDRFLTLAATDAGDGIGWDWIVFGDPRLDIVDLAAEPQTR